MPLLFWPAALCALIYLPLSSRPAGALRSLTKTLAVALLALAAASQGAPMLLVAALALCALGDALLAQETQTSFMAGIGAFALGHLTYAALFLWRPGADPAHLLSAPLATASLLALGAIAARILAPRASDLRGPVLGYIPVILAMGLAAFSQPDRLIQAAALCFVASDLILAAEKFVLPDGAPLLRVTPYLIWPLYWLAQLGFVLAII